MSWRKGQLTVEALNLSNVLLALGGFIGTAIAAFIGYKVPRKPEQQQQGSILAAIGTELGSRADIKMLTDAVIRIGDIMENKHDAELAANMKEVLQRMDKMQHPPEIRTHQPNEPLRKQR